jgi:guanylate kinase
MLVKDRKLGRFSFSVSHTTRPPRQGEVHGRDYYFVDHAAFRSMVARREFAEHAKVHGNFYGTSLGEIQRLKARGGDGIIFDIDYQGALQIKRRLPQALAVFILPPGIGELRNRLRKRGTENRKNLVIRLKNAIREIKQYRIFDYVILNDRLLKAYSDLATVIRAHRLSRVNAESTVGGLLGELKKRRPKAKPGAVRRARGAKV